MEKDTHAFIIRIWYEARDSEGNILAWRGSIDHVGSRKRLYFQDFDGIVRFIQEQSGIGSKKKKSLLRSTVDWIQNEFNKIRRKLHRKPIYRD